MNNKSTIDNNLLEVLKCPECEMGEITTSGSQHIICINCKSEFPLIEGIPSFIKGEETHEGFEYQWEKRAEGDFEVNNLYGKTEQDEYDQFFEYLDITLQDLDGKKVLDGGCGSGRLIKLLKKHNQLSCFGIDISQTIFSMGKTNKQTNTNFLRGNLLRLPLKNDTFDYIWTGGVIHHTGDTPLAFSNLAGSLKPAGKLYVWVYSSDQKVFGKARQLFSWAYLLPNSVLRILCFFLAIPIYMGGILARKPHPFSEVEFKLFDHLNPHYRTVHSNADVVGWFEQAGFKDIKIKISQESGGVGVLGIKK